MEKWFKHGLAIGEMFPFIEMHTKIHKKIDSDKKGKSSDHQIWP